MSTLRFKAVEQASSRRAVVVDMPLERPDSYFAEQVFTRVQMSKHLPADVYARLVNSIDNGALLSRDIADQVARGMREWATQKGATHYTHWFQPLTGGTAEKHDAFVEHNGLGGLVEELSGKMLIQQEPDASSFPSGGIRNTFEARGYSAWDASSPAFVVDDTLCIPTIFIAYTGEALDYKTPLLRSLSAVEKASLRVCRLFDKKVNKVTSFLGWEQEYFLVDESLYSARADLVMTGRTLMGHDSARNQQLEDHYFGSIPTRVLQFMKELEFECWRLGIPAKTRHNEVAPNQFELAPIYEECNLANDHNLLLMSVMKKVARRHYFRVLVHEKPFKGVNGSGKHCNWSLGTDTGVNLLSPGKSAADNLQFVTYLVNVLMAVHTHNGLLKASIASAGNQHRLGANEAPPSIISCFMGTQLSQVLDRIENAESDQAIVLDQKVGLKLGVTHIPEILLDNTDRNRTSPFAFTGNRFEFRALGSSDNCASAMIVLNAAVADQLNAFSDRIEQMVESGVPTQAALFEVIRDYIKQSKAIRFDGNGYGDQWKREAQRRGLDCQVNVPLTIDHYLSEKSVSMFERTGVFTLTELHSRCEVKWETYTKKVQIESRVLGDLALNHIIPIASRYQSVLLDNIVKMKEVFGEQAQPLVAQDKELVASISQHATQIKIKTTQMIQARKHCNSIENERDKALAYSEQVFPLLDAIRYHVDKLELVVDNQLWTLPKYRELLFIR